MGTRHQGDGSRNVLIRMAFEGTRYHGFQVQQNAVTVCQVLQDAMQAVFGHRPPVKGCSRTDAGVHALDFCVSFRAPGSIPLAKLPLALNHHLPADVRVHSAQPVPDDFHARYAAQEKEYHYHILNAAVDDAFTPRLHLRVAGGLDEGAMHAAGQALVGRHNFAAFMASGSTVDSTVRTVTRLAVVRSGARVCLRVAADGFLYNMVRIMAGTLLAVGQGKLPPAAVADIRDSRRRENAGPTLPARGLYLARVFYGRPALDEIDRPGAPGTAP